MPYKKRKDNLWCVYKHTSPSDGVYIGITSDYPLARWRNGRGYDCCEVMNKAIKNMAGKILLMKYYLII
jgi:hypothetical protein